jgi:hypothetical protein
MNTKYNSCRVRGIRIDNLERANGRSMLYRIIIDQNTKALSRIWMLLYLNDHFIDIIFEI